MKRKETTTEYREAVEQDYYQTGQVAPPRQNGLVAILLVMVVLLTGMTSILSVLNIRLFSALRDERISDAPPALADLREDSVPVSQHTDVAVRGIPGLGITVDTVTGVYQRHFMLPEGLFITHVTRGSDAQRQGLQEGDVLLYLGELRCSREEQLRELLSQRQIGDAMKAVIYRSSTNENLVLELTVEEIFQHDD